MSSDKQKPSAMQPQNRRDADQPRFDLGSFFPYQVRIYYLAVSQSVSDIYSSRYGLSVAEWRTMAVLGNHQPLTASDVVQRSSIDKVSASRAIQALLKREFLERQTDPRDRRRVNLHLTARGQAAFDDLVPRVQELEQRLLGGLSEEEQSTLLTLMNKVRDTAEQINHEHLHSSSDNAVNEE